MFQVNKEEVEPGNQNCCNRHPPVFDEFEDQAHDKIKNGCSCPGKGDVLFWNHVIKHEQHGKKQSYQICVPQHFRF